MTFSESSEKNDYSDRVAFYDVEYLDNNDLPFLKDLAGDAKTVLELPCGSGIRALHFAEMGKHVTAIDREPGMIALLDEKLKPRPELHVKSVIGDR